MGKLQYIPFDDIKASYSIEEIMELTGLPFRKDGKSFRCECPEHGGGKRSLVVTPEETDEKGDRGVFYCFGEKEGGDRVSLLAHIRGTKQYAAFKELAEKKPPQKTKKAAEKPPETVPEEKEEGGAAERGFRPLPYLQPEHEAVQAMGFKPETAKALGLGFSPRGVHRGRVAIPVRTADGTLAGYFSITADTSVQLPPKWHL